MKKKALKKKGFSLVELMVVVAIIGILAVIGIPQYQKFMSKARQAEAKSHLNAIFQGESSYFTEYNHYTNNLRAIGGGAVGQNLRYNAGFVGVGTTGCTGGQPVGTGAPPLGGAADNDLIGIAGSSAAWTYGASLTETGLDTSLGVCSYTATSATYAAGAWGNPTNTPTTNNNDDQFTINQTRLLTHVQVGL
ncbi:MAG: prepilin-type N-terminal cleavage/methylation domain-containing protein [Bdellovibrionaceae bacterium]|nr:prepilin-type N-terminal cleavage/methylation domain-containing protein [Pseudobdellovibrionaceae bacterium]